MSNLTNRKARMFVFNVCVAVIGLLLPLSIQGQVTATAANNADDSEARPPVTAIDLKIVKRARELLDMPAKWNRADNRECPTGAKTVSLYCALQNATTELTGKSEHRGAALQEARFVIDEIAVNRNYEHRLMNYNNDPSTTFADIQKVFDIVEQLIALRLKAEAVPMTANLVTKADVEIAKRARQLLDSPSKWNREATQTCPAGAKTFNLYCALASAATEVNGTYTGGEAAVREARQLVDESRNAKNYKARLVDFNDDPAITFADVQKLLQQVQERLTKRLAGAGK